MSNSTLVESDTKKLWKAVRGFIKEAVLVGEIQKDMKPKAVYEKYKDIPVMAVVAYGDKFSRMLRALRKKHKDGDLENEGLKVIEWGRSGAKQFLKVAFREKTIPSNYADEQQVWNDHCKDHKAFARMQYDAAFKRRLNSVRDDYELKAKRCEKDQKAFDIAVKNHPTPKLNFRGEPQWNGSRAQELLKLDIADGKHTTKEPIALRESKEEYKVYSLDTFRDHIYQELRLIKFQHYVDSLKQKKIDDLQY